MLGASNRFDLLGSRPAGDKIDLAGYAKALGQAGFKVIVMDPGGSKIPIDMRTAPQKKADDEAAQTAAREADDPRWAEVAIKAGIQMATSDPKRLAAYVQKAEKQYGASPNLAVLVEGFLVVDVDWAEGVARFAQESEANGAPVGLTVSSPGVQNQDGAWHHGPGGGHFYFALPEGYELPEHAMNFTGGTGREQASFFVGDHYVLIPPSTRTEGAYTFMGNEVLDAPQWVLDLVAFHADERRKKLAFKAQRAAARAGSGPSDIDTWSAGITWADLLVPDGWTETGRSACGCLDFKAPGDHASPKSATAHEPGCTRYDYTHDWCPLHVWTDNPPVGIADYYRETNSKTLTPIQYVAWTHHGGNIAAACRAVGLPSMRPELRMSTAESLVAAAAETNAETTGDEVGDESDFINPGPAAPCPVITLDFGNSGGTSVSSGLDSGDTEMPELASLPEEFRKREFNPYDTSVYPRGFHSDPELLRQVFDFSPETREIFHTARGHRPKPAHPFALLHRELLRRGMRAPVDVRPWPSTPLSTYVTAVGRSGTGKTIVAMPTVSPWPDLKAPKAVAAAAAEQGEDAVGQPIVIPYDFDRSRRIGSGQVLAAMLTIIEGRGDVKVTRMRPHPVAWADEDEMMNLLRAAKGDAATIIPALNAAWSGRPIGNETITRGDGNTPGDYGVFLWGGLQPKFAEELLAHDDSGFLQRCVFTAVTDPYRLIDEPKILRPAPKPMGEMPPLKPGDRFTLDPSVEATIEASIVDADFDHLAEDGAEEASHAVQVRVRIACLAALLHGTTHVSQALWDWTGLIMEHSQRVYAFLQAEKEKTAGVRDTKTGHRRANERAAEASFSTTMTDEVAEKILALIGRVGAEGVTRGRITATITDSKHRWIPAAIQRLMTDQLIWLDGTRYKRKLAAASA